MKRQNCVIAEGAQVLGLDGACVGTVKRVTPTFCLVETSCGETDKYMYVPALFVQHVQSDMVVIGLPGGRVADMGWEEVPAAPTGISSVRDSLLRGVSSGPRRAVKSVLPPHGEPRTRRVA